MHRIDTKTAQKDKFGAGKNGFTRGNPQTGTPATDLDDDYFDMLQEELCSVVEASGASLEKARHDQLLTALRALLLSRKNPFGDIKSDGTVKTALENLGLGEAAKMSAAALVINGNTLTAKIPVVINGVNREFIIQASQISSSASNGVITFPSAFPNACIAIFAHDFATASTDLSNVRFYMPGRTSASWTGQNMSTGSESSPATWCWLAIGW
ncbi:TPA: gp53-like domain-containing protein [Escherichia coli]|uniref:gp53-like domain-containing protein n=1 Tax=Escherichia coli TaxID=562 RepID=UPI00388FDC74